MTKKEALRERIRELWRDWDRIASEIDRLVADQIMVREEVRRLEREMEELG